MDWTPVVGIGQVVIAAVQVGAGLGVKRHRRRLREVERTLDRRLREVSTFTERRCRAIENLARDAYITAARAMGLAEALRPGGRRYYDPPLSG